MRYSDERKFDENFRITYFGTIKTQCELDLKVPILSKER